MTANVQRITPFLWFNDEAEEAAHFYVSVFPNSRVNSITRYSKEAALASGQKDGAAMTVAFVLDGQPFTALNGGPMFHFTEAVSFVIHCETQADIDRYWEKLSDGGDSNAQRCGWLKDKYGLSWQVIPNALPQLLSRGAGAVKAMLSMKKLDIEQLRKAGE